MLVTWICFYERLHITQMRWIKDAGVFENILAQWPLFLLLQRGWSSRHWNQLWLPLWPWLWLWLSQWLSIWWILVNNPCSSLAELRNKAIKYILGLWSSETEYNCQCMFWQSLQQKFIKCTDWCSHRYWCLFRSIMHTLETSIIQFCVIHVLHNISST